MTTFPYNGTFGTPAANAINMAVTPPVGAQIVGAPQLSFTYQGIGNGKAVFAQLIDDATGRVVGNMVIFNEGLRMHKVPVIKGRPIVVTMRQ